MKKHIFLLLLLFAMPVLVHPVTEEGVTISRLSMEPLPFNERRDPAADSPYNAFDGDVKTAALYSDFTLEFSKPVTIDEIKIMNGNSLNKDFFKKSNRERDIEITLYTISAKPDKKSPEKKTKKPKKADPRKAEDKKNPVKDKDLKIEDSKEKALPDKNVKEKTQPEKIDPKGIQKGIDEENKKKIKEEKYNTRDKIVYKDEYETAVDFNQESVKLFYIASETAAEPDKKPAEKVKTEKTKPAVKENKSKKADKAPDKKKTAEKKKTPAAKASTGKTELKKDIKKDKNRNIIEITDSKKERNEKSSEFKKRLNEAAKKEEQAESIKAPSGETEIKKTLAGEDKPSLTNPDKTAEKVSIPAKPEIKKSSVKNQKKTAAKKDVKKPLKGAAIKKPAVKDKNIKSKTEKKKDDSVKAKTVEAAKTSDKSKKREAVKSPAADLKGADNKKNIKPADEKKTVIKTPAKKITDKKQGDKKELKKTVLKKPEETKTEAKKKEAKKTEAKKKEEKNPADDIPVKKMTGVVRIQNDKDGRVLVYTTLKDSMDFQSIGLKGEYAVTKIDFRTRDDQYYPGTEADRSGITEVAFLNNGKRVALQGIEGLKKTYAERFSKNLTGSISGETFIMYENGEIALRMRFRKDGRIEFFDRFKCSKKGDPDCTSLSMPDMWRVTDGKLYMRYHTLWRVWKYELDSGDDMLGENIQPEPPRWMKIYYKSENGFTDKYLELYRSEKGVWAE